MALILASQSPRRKELLGLFHIPFLIRVADVDEVMDPQKLPFDEVARVSRLKAMAVKAEPEDIVIAADTIVVLGNTVLGKPKNEDDAFGTLSALSGKDHQVMTGITLRQGNRCVSTTEVTDIHFRPLSEKEIRAYIASGDPMDKAGSYGIQNGAALFVDKIVGDYYNVMGLPVCRLWQMLREFAPELMEDPL